MNMVKKKICQISALALVMFCLLGGTNAYAKTLKESFSGGSYVTESTVTRTGQYFKKTAWAKTEGYDKYHYVRAYVGGSSNSAKNACADTGRKYSNGDIYVSCTASDLFVANGSYAVFPTAYAKYGTK